MSMKDNSILTPFSLGASLRRALTGAAVLLGSLAAAPAAQAQWTWVNAQNPDYSAAFGSASQVENTGNDYVAVDRQFLRVMCWDGAKPGLGWSLSPDKNPGAVNMQLLLGAGGTVSDPDVVADPGRFGTAYAPTTNVLVVYLLNGDLVYEVQRYDAASNTMNPVYSFPQLLVPSRGGASNPNVDVDGNGQAVITWAQRGSIYGMVYDLPTLTAYAPCLVAQRRGIDLVQPDVATSAERGRAINTSFIYLANDPFTGLNSVRMVQVSSADLKASASVNTGVGTDVLPNVPSGRSFYDAPRIAAGYDGHFTPTDFEAVVGDLHDNFIYGLNAFNSTGPVSPSSLPTVQTLNTFGNLHWDGPQCRRPVVSLCGDAFAISWMVDDSQIYNGTPNPNPTLNRSQEIALSYTNWAGIPVNNPGPYAHYSIVNYDQRGSQTAPSVAGRYSSFFDTNVYPNMRSSACYTFFDDSQQDVLFKSGDSYATAVRSTGPNKDKTPAVTAGPTAMSAYPNPFRDRTTLSLHLAVGETIQALAVYSPTGQLVRQQLLPAPDAQQVQWDATGLSAGLYLVRLRTSAGATHTYRLQHE